MVNRRILCSFQLRDIIEDGLCTVCSVENPSRYFRLCMIVCVSERRSESVCDREYSSAFKKIKKRCAQQKTLYVAWG